MEQQPVYTFAKWQVKENHLQTVLGIMVELVQKSTSEEGNLFYKIHQSNSDVNTLVLFEGYTNDAAISQHRESIHYQDIVVQKIVPLLENREVVVTTPLEQ